MNRHHPKTFRHFHGIGLPLWQRRDLKRYTRGHSNLQQKKLGERTLTFCWERFESLISARRGIGTCHNFRETDIRQSHRAQNIQKRPIEKYPKYDVVDVGTQNLVGTAGVLAPLVEHGAGWSYRPARGSRHQRAHQSWRARHQSGKPAQRKDRHPAQTPPPR